MKKLVYVGPYTGVEAGGIAFVRDVPADCPDALADELLAKLDADGPIFSEAKAAKAASKEA
jgi:hypothetical protein